MKNTSNNNASGHGQAQSLTRSVDLTSAVDVFRNRFLSSKNEWLTQKTTHVIVKTARASCFKTQLTRQVAPLVRLPNKGGNF